MKVAEGLNEFIPPDNVEECKYTIYNNNKTSTGLSGELTYSGSHESWIADVNVSSLPKDDYSYRQEVACHFSRKIFWPTDTPQNSRDQESITR